MQELKIDHEFKILIPSPTAEEYRELEQKILTEGFDSKTYGAIVTWNDFVIDGHNRYEICTNNNIPFVTESKIFNSREEVKEWIIRNQFARRNIDTYTRTKLALQLESLIKAKAKENQKLSEGRGEKGLPPVANLKPVHTDIELAKIAGVSHNTIKFARVVENQATPEQKQSLESGEKKIKTVYKEIKAKEEPKIEPIKPNESKKNYVEASQVDNKVDIAEFRGTIVTFVHDITKFAYMDERYQVLSKEEKSKFYEEVGHVEKLMKDIRKSIKGDNAIC